MNSDWKRAGGEAIKHGCLTAEDWDRTWAEVAETAQLAGVSAADVGTAMAKATFAGIRPVYASAGVQQAIMALHQPSEMALGLASNLSLPSLITLLPAHGLIGALATLATPLQAAADCRTMHVAKFFGILLGTYSAMNVALALCGQYGDNSRRQSNRTIGPR